MFNAFWRAAVALAVLMSAAAACAPALTPSPHPTPAVLVIQRTPALATLNPIFERCIDELTNTGLVVQEMPPGLPDASQTGLSLRWGMVTAPSGYAAVIGEEQLVVVVNRRNPLEEMDLQTIREIYNSSMKTWPEAAEAGEIQAWVYAGEEDIQQNFEQAVNNGEALGYNQHYLAPGPAAMIEAVSESATAIGFLPQRWLNEQVKQVRIRGLEPEQMLFPILSLSPAEPAGAEKAWLLCVQDQLKQP
jgi:hypothetical protein